jgi:hypothetical protein
VTLERLEATLDRLRLLRDRASSESLSPTIGPSSAP